MTYTRTWYVDSNHGSDHASGGTADHPLKSTHEALARAARSDWDTNIRVCYMAGHAETLAELPTPPMIKSGPIDDVSVDGEDPSWDYLRPQIRFQAAPTAVEDVNGMIQIDDPTSTMVMVHDPTKSWTPGQHTGKSIIHPGAPAEVGVIWDNTATELLVSMVGANLTAGTHRIIDRSASLTFSKSLQISASVLPAVGFIGLNLSSDGPGPAVDIVGSSNLVQFLMCDISGGFQARDGARRVQVDACRLRNGPLSIDCHNLAIRQSYLSGLTSHYHAVSGQYDLYGCRVRDCGSMGHGGSGTPNGGFRIDNCWISEGRDSGIVSYGGTRSRVTNTRIESCHGDAIWVDGRGTLTLDTITGGGSTGYGCRIGPGADVRVAGSVTVRGNGSVEDPDPGEVMLGNAWWHWVNAPQGNNRYQNRFG